MQCEADTLAEQRRVQEETAQKEKAAAEGKRSRTKKASKAAASAK